MINTENWEDNWRKKKKNKGKVIAFECNCDNPDKVDVIHYGNFKEIFEYCNKCGGVII